ncbi:uncharacterized protein MKZ38_005291 [Zalerion maritima]|uniref:DUF4048 domain-containing protein n=1 Tax=Zalerion maritima TaxID=339359 RepID=A0AAD5RKV6_9PEZI|nr:uncharacterized protein MKZ38_005291 [Zalerion maritima]
MSVVAMDGSGRNRNPICSDARQSLDSIQPSRSTSPASRNRLSLTLPIAPPNGHSSRPTPTSAVHPSFPPTPSDVSSGVTTPKDPADLIHAIAAQERRVLELREELKHAEHHLKKLRREYLHVDKGTRQSRHHVINPLSAGLADSYSGDDALAQRRSVELDRRRALLAAHQQQQQQQQQRGQQGQQTDGKKRVFRGHHARALSLVSPTRSVSASEFEETTDDGKDSTSTSSVGTAATSMSGGPSLHHRNHSMLAKRATWNINPGRNTPAGIKQFADDFKVGLWTFVEDIRQATVGEEAINSQAGRSPNDTTPRPARSTAVEAEGGDTIRASTAARPKASSLFADAPATETPQKSKSSPSQRPKVTRQDSKNKRFSYTPLTDDLNDDDWSNWDSPTIGVPSPRWSGSTVSNGEASASVEVEATPSKPSSSNRNSLQFLTGAKLEELPWQAMNKLSPSNITKTASKFMDQWEKSLANTDDSPSSPSRVDSGLAYPNPTA